MIDSQWRYGDESTFDPIPMRTLLLFSYNVRLRRCKRRVYGVVNEMRNVIHEKLLKTEKIRSFH